MSLYEELAIGTIGDEFEGADLGDIRLKTRLKTVAENAIAQPDKSFPQQARTDAALEGTYRLLRNPRVSWDEILESHIQCSIERIKRSPRVFIPYDTTDITFEAEEPREGLIRFGAHRQGFRAHCAVAFSGDGHRIPLGVLGLLPIFRDEREKETMDCEFDRWGNLALSVGERVKGIADAIHLMDREADSYALFAQLKGANLQFVIRATQDRFVQIERDGKQEKTRMLGIVEQAEPVAGRVVHIAKRSDGRRLPKDKKAFPSRKERDAMVLLSACKLRIVRPINAKKSFPETLDLNFVRAYEVNTPEGEQPIDWWLITSLPIDTPNQVEDVVNAYQVRWCIEEYFKALKTGCSFGERQLESRKTIMVAFSIFMAVAWRLLLLRTLPRLDEEMPATEALSENQIKVLQAMAKTGRFQLKISTERMPTIKEAMLAVAKLGGHITNNGAPGWQVLARGLNQLQMFEEGWSLHEQVFD